MSVGDAFLAERLKEIFEIIEGLDMKVDQVLEGLDEQEEKMATITEALTVISDGMAGLEEDVQRLIDAVEAGGDLTPEQQDAVDALKARMDAMNTAADEAVPPQVINP